MKTSDFLCEMVCTNNQYRGGAIVGTGVNTTDRDVAAATVRAFARQRQNFPLVCGSSPREEKRRNKQFQAAVSSDVKRELGIGLFGALLLLLGGPLGLVIGIISVVFEELLSKEIDPLFQSMYGAIADGDQQIEPGLARSLTPKVMASPMARGINPPSAANRPSGGNRPGQVGGPG